MKGLKAGKLDSDMLKEIVIDQIRLKRPEVRVRAGIGEDCAVVAFGNYDCVISTDPITADVNDIGRLSIHISCNDIASNGIAPLGITLAVMLPVGTTKEDIRTIMAQAAKAAEAAGVEIIGGHTEITGAVNQPVIVSTAFGRALNGESQSAGDMKPGDHILLTKTAGLEGTGIIATDKKEQLASVLTEQELSEAASLLDQVSVVPEGVIAGRIGTSGMHDVTEGGVLGAVWEICQIAGLGAVIDVEKIPVLDVTKKISGHFGIDYLRLISSGCMLIAASEKNAAEILRQLKEAGITATEIGRVTGKGEPVKAIRVPEALRQDVGEKIEGEDAWTVRPPEADELYKVV